MIDSVIAGTGDSRYLRSSIADGTTWAEALALLRAGTFPIDLAGINANGFSTLGTALNAENLLDSDTATALGLSSSSTPDDALNALILLLSAKAGIFIVTLTPTALDYSGTMDKTPAEIWAAYQTGKLVLFSIPAMSAELVTTQFLEVDTDNDTENDAVIVAANILYNPGNGNSLFHIATNTSDSTYNVVIYPLWSYIQAPSSPSSGQFLQWDGSAWVAASLPVYNGGFT